MSLLKAPPFLLAMTLKSIVAGVRSYYDRPGDYSDNFHHVDDGARFGMNGMSFTAAPGLFSVPLLAL